VNKRDLVQEVIQNPKIGLCVAAATAGTGTSTAFGWIPADIGNLASLIGAILSSVLLVIHLISAFKGVQDLNAAKLRRIKSELEVEKIKLEIRRLRGEGSAQQQQNTSDSTPSDRI
jgi:hypothetical protein